MAKTGFSVETEGVVALAAATAKTILSVTAPATHGIDLIAWSISLDGTTSSASPVLVEICQFTAATAGTSTAATVDTRYGRVITWGGSAAKNYTVEPTVITPWATIWLDPYKCHYSRDYALGQTPDCPASQGFLIRCTAPAAVNARAIMRFERC
jgi:hypothetical protein